jgi:KAP family P-loop domain
MALDSTGQTIGSPSPLVAGDLIPDRALTPSDRDEFDYEPIAARIADLCCAVEAPVNIALFSPWGSGKSSLFSLIGSRLAAREERVRLIRYDAWRYGGEALPRNFIAHAARELDLPLEDPRYAEFHRGLYENQRHVRLSPPRFFSAIRNLRFGPLLVLAAALLLGGWLLGIDSLVAGALASIAVLLITALIDAGKVVVEQTRPSEDEEFSRRFERLITWATDPGREATTARRSARRLRGRLTGYLANGLGLYRLAYWWYGRLPLGTLEAPVVDRLVFFIDELDRCDSEDIVATLKAIRTFLDAERCVFIVAADRQAIEEALTGVEQSTPIDPTQPYYNASAGAYLDKIFQHQIALPPLRSRSLAKFARSLAVGAGGIWDHLSSADPDPGEATPTLDLVLFTLIPSHISSPRRVKVLLNNYATNVRMVCSRLPEAWPRRAREIARMTTFQTEFADFAADLAIEPRLPRFLLDRRGAPESEAVQVALARWNLDPAEGDEDAEDPDAMLRVSEAEPDAEARGDSHLDEKRHQLQKRRREELRRYLERTADVDDLRRDLLYLQPAGAGVGLEDYPDLAELIETEATDSPDTVIDALDEVGPKQLAGSARLLSSMVADVLGPEQKQVMSALMHAVALLGEEAGTVSQEVAGALKTYWTGAGELAEDLLIGALRTALSVRRRDPTLAVQILRDERLWSDAGRVSEVVAMAAELHEGKEIERLRVAVARHMPEDYEVILGAVDELVPDQRFRVMDDGVIFDSIGSAIDFAEAAAGQAEAEAEAEE